MRYVVCGCVVELAQGAGQLSRAVATLSTAEEHTSLARALSQLSEVQEKVESVHQAQSDADFYVLSELIHDYVGMLHAVKVLRGPICTTSYDSFILFCCSSQQSHTHTHTHPFNGPLSGTTRVSRYQKGKPTWILLKQETVSSSGISWAMCKSAPRFRQITTPAPHHSVFYRPDALPAAQRQSTEGNRFSIQI